MSSIAAGAGLILAVEAVREDVSQCCLDRFLVVLYDAVVVVIVVPGVSDKRPSFVYFDGRVTVSPSGERRGLSLGGKKIKLPRSGKGVILLCGRFFNSKF